MRFRDYFNPRHPVGQIGWAIGGTYLLLVGIPLAVIYGLGLAQ